MPPDTGSAAEAQAEASVTRAVQPFHIMTKPVSGTCNLDCGYCYYTMKPRELYPDTKKFLMTEEVLADFVRQNENRRIGDSH